MRKLAREKIQWVVDELIAKPAYFYYLVWLGRIDVRTGRGKSLLYILFCGKAGFADENRYLVWYVN